MNTVISIANALGALAALATAMINLAATRRDRETRQLSGSTDGQD